LTATFFSLLLGIDLQAKLIYRTMSLDGLAGKAWTGVENEKNKADYP
jgi:hypothetical protein